MYSGVRASDSQVIEISVTRYRTLQGLAVDISLMKSLSRPLVTLQHRQRLTPRRGEHLTVSLMRMFTGLARLKIHWYGY